MISRKFKSWMPLSRKKFWANGYLLRVGYREQSLSYDNFPGIILLLYLVFAHSFLPLAIGINVMQRARFKSVESLQKESRAVVVATDVAARGLDIPDVATVVHYDVARKVDGFVHRAGRTAVSHQSLLSCCMCFEVEVIDCDYNWISD